MVRNVVLCLDGTGNELGPNASNVLLLHRMLVQDEMQLAYYDPGVGTFAVKPRITEFARSVQEAVGLAFGYGIRENILEAYRFLMRTYVDKDRIYIYGFSRGAYTARVLAALIKTAGILPAGLENLAPYALRHLEEADFDGMDQLRSQFKSRQPRIHFLGVWDTVASVSWTFDRQVYPYSDNNDIIDHVRHAVALDERRTFFRPSPQSPQQQHKSKKEVFFAGVHSDIGGSYPPDESGLAKVALEWMVVESRLEELLIDDAAALEVFESTQPDPVGPRHESLTGPWWACEVVPKKYWDWKRLGWRTKFNFGRRRPVPDGATIHRSVLIRREATGYDPAGVPDSPASVEQRVAFKTKSGDSLPDWSPSPDSRDEKVANWVLNPVVAALAIYVVVGLPFIAGAALFWLLFRSGAPSSVADAATWPRWIVDIGRVLGERWLYVALLWPAAFIFGTWLLGKVAPTPTITEKLRGGKLPHMQLWPLPRKVKATLDRIGEDGRKEYRRSLCWDYLFMVVYGGAFAAAWHFTELGWMAWPVLVMGVSILADVLENSCLLVQLGRMPERFSRGLCNLTGLATTAKLLGIAVAVGALTVESLRPLFD